MWNLVPWKKTEAGGLATQPIERDLTRLRSDFDALLHQIWHNWPAQGAEWLDSRFGAGLDVDETDSHYVIHVTAPGREVGDFDVSISGRQLIIRAERKESHNNGNGSNYRHGVLERQIALPEGACTDLIDAEYRAGILTVKLPKGPGSQAKRIPVKSA